MHKKKVMRNMASNNRDQKSYNAIKQSISSSSVRKLNY